MTLTKVREVLTADSIGKNRQGQFVARWSFFYRMDRTAEKYAQQVKKVIPCATIVDKGEHWVPFRGGASIARSSHFYVVFEIDEVEELRGWIASKTGWSHADLAHLVIGTLHQMRDEIIAKKITTDRSWYWTGSTIMPKVTP